MTVKALRSRLAEAVADAYQFAGRHDSPAFVLDFLCWLSRMIDPVKVPPDCINLAMLKGISKSIGIPIEELSAEDDEDGGSAASASTDEGQEEAPLPGQ